MLKTYVREAKRETEVRLREKCSTKKTYEVGNHLC